MFVNSGLHDEVKFLCLFGCFFFELLISLTLITINIFHLWLGTLYCSNWSIVHVYPNLELVTTMQGISLRILVDNLLNNLQQKITRENKKLLFVLDILVLVSNHPNPIVFFCYFTCRKKLYILSLFECGQLSVQLNACF